jgi:hypothetical protein
MSVVDSCLKTAGSSHILSEEQMKDIRGGQDAADYITLLCKSYAVYGVIAMAIPGVNLVGASTVGAFCAGWAVGNWIFG